MSITHCGTVSLRSIDSVSPPESRQSSLNKTQEVVSDTAAQMTGHGQQQQQDGRSVKTRPTWLEGRSKCPRTKEGEQLRPLARSRPRRPQGCLSVNGGEECREQENDQAAASHQCQHACRGHHTEQAKKLFGAHPLCLKRPDELSLSSTQQSSFPRWLLPGFAGNLGVKEVHLL